MCFASELIKLFQVKPDIHMNESYTRLNP